MKNRHLKHFRKSAPIPLPIQYLNLRSKRPELLTVIKNGVLTTVGRLKPFPWTRDYEILMRLTDKSHPSVFIKKPNLVVLSGKRKIPHLYDQATAKLCLYYPKYDEWTRDMLLTETILVWASEWIAHFEIWLITDEWTGEGIHYE